MSELLNRNAPPVTESGLYPDLTGVTAPLFINGRNVHFRGGAVTPIPGQVPLFTRPATNKVTGLHSQIISGEQTAVFGYLASLHKWDLTNGVTNLGSGYTGNLLETATAKATFWSIESWGNWILATNGQEQIQICKTTSFANLTGTPPTTAEILVRRSPFMLALNTATDGAEYAWCDADDVENWVASPSTSAGAKVIRDTGGPITCAKEFRNEVAAFTEDTMHFITYLPGSTNIFGDRKLLNGIGCEWKNGCVTAGAKIFGWGNRGIWVTDGASFDYIDTIHLKEFLYQNLDQEQMSQICVYHDRAWQHIAFFFPSKGANGVCDMAVTFNYREKNWTIYDFGRSVADHGSVFRQALLGSNDGFVFSQDNEIITPQNYGQGILQLTPTATIGGAGYGYFGYGQTPYGGGNIEVEG